jgi:phage baseplate assembly protein W
MSTERSWVSQHIGFGLAWPLRPQDGKLPRAQDLARIQQALRMILETEPGERLMRPSFGCGLRRFLQQPNSGATRAQIEREVREALARDEPRIELLEINVEPDAQVPSAVWVIVDYRLRLDGQRDSLVFPFSLE